MSDDVSRPETALIVRPTVLPSMSQFSTMRELALRLAEAKGFLPDHYFEDGNHRPIPGKEKFARVLAAIEYGRAVGIEPMIALQNITMIHGKASASAMLIAAQLRRGGYKIRTTWHDAQGNPVGKEKPIGQEPGQLWGCKVTLSKNGEETGDGVFSLTDAQRAGLIKEDSGWKRYPKDMLYARALTQAAREGGQDAILGMQYTAEELGADVDEDGRVSTLPPEALVAMDAEFTEVPGVQEATAVSPPPTAAIQPAPPAPAAAQQQPEGESPSEPAVETEPASSPPAAVPAPAANAAPVMPLSGASVSRRLGAGRSISPVRRNVTTVQPAQAAETPATAPEAPPAPAPQPDPVPSQPAPAALTDEPVLPPTAEPEDPGKAVYLNQLRGDLRIQTAELFRVNALLDNVKRGLEGKEPNEVPPPTPSEASDQALAARIDQDWPGRKLETLGEPELKALMERFDANLAKKRDVLRERGISEE